MRPVVLRDRLIEFFDQVRERAKQLPPGPERDALFHGKGLEWLSLALSVENQDGQTEWPTGDPDLLRWLERRGVHQAGNSGDELRGRERLG